MLLLTAFAVRGLLLFEGGKETVRILKIKEEPFKIYIKCLIRFHSNHDIFAILSMFILTSEDPEVIPLIYFHGNYNRCREHNKKP